MIFIIVALWMSFVSINGSNGWTQDFSVRISTGSGPNDGDTSDVYFKLTNYQGDQSSAYQIVSGGIDPDRNAQLATTSPLMVKPPNYDPEDFQSISIQRCASTSGDLRLDYVGIVGPGISEICLGTQLSNGPNTNCVGSGTVVIDGGSTCGIVTIDLGTCEVTGRPAGDPSFQCPTSGSGGPKKPPRPKAVRENAISDKRDAGVRSDRRDNGGKPSRRDAGGVRSDRDRRNSPDVGPDEQEADGVITVDLPQMGVYMIGILLMVNLVCMAYYFIAKNCGWTKSSNRKYKTVSMQSDVDSV